MKRVNFLRIYNRPPTKQMIEKLKHCLEKEAQGTDPCLAEEMKSSLAGLYKRGFVETKMEVVNNKKLLCIYVTNSGKEFLNSQEDSNFPKTEKN